MIGVIASGLIAVMFMTTVEMPFTLIVSLLVLKSLDPSIKFDSNDYCVNCHYNLWKPYWSERDHK